MTDLAQLARDAMDAHDRKLAIVRFSVCQIQGRRCAPVTAWRAVLTDQPEVAAFLLACWNNREALARLSEIDRRGIA